MVKPFPRLTDFNSINVASRLQCCTESYDKHEHEHDIDIQNLRVYACMAMHGASFIVAISHTSTA